MADIKFMLLYAKSYVNSYVDRCFDKCKNYIEKRKKTRYEKKMAEEFYLKIPDIAYFLTTKKHSAEYNKMQRVIEPYLARMNLKDWDKVSEYMKKNHMEVYEDELQYHELFNGEE